MLRLLFSISYHTRYFAASFVALSGWFCGGIGLLLYLMGSNDRSAFCLLLGCFSMASAAYIRPSDPPHTLPTTPSEPSTEEADAKARAKG